jgi:very-short-patch-repair endonuclease
MAEYKQWNRSPARWHRQQKPAAREMRRAPTETEQLLWGKLRRRQLAGLHFRRQHPLGPYIADFFCVDAQLVIEIDGAIHERTDQIERDTLRSEGLKQIGVKVLRFTTADVMHRMDWVLARIRGAIDDV